jgi:hypothetical protein
MKSKEWDRRQVRTTRDNDLLCVDKGWSRENDQAMIEDAKDNAISREYEIQIINKFLIEEHTVQ